MERKRAKVHMLPTGEKGVIVIRADKPYVHMLERNSPYSAYGKGGSYESKEHTYHHLYITTDEEIKEGDWYYDPINNCVRQCEDDKRAKLLKAAKHLGHRKIIASTAPKLTTKCDCPNNQNVCTSKSGCKPLPQPSKAFVVKYCNLGGILEVDIEIQWYEGKTLDEDGDPILEYVFKVDPNHNTITIHPIKEK